MLTSLLSGSALTASELAQEAGITPQTASSHLAKLQEGGLITVLKQGRHRYFRLAAEDVVHLLEGLMGVADRTHTRKYKTGPRDPEMRRARVCYDHIAGDIGVELYEGFVKNRLIKISDQANESGGTITLTQKGMKLFHDLDLSIEPRMGSRRPVCRPCLDWSVRRFHLAGVLGVSVLDMCYRKKWAKRLPDSRTLRFTPRGEAQLFSTFLINR